MWCRKARLRLCSLSALWFALKVGVSPRVAFLYLEAVTWQVSKLRGVSASRLTRACRSQLVRSSHVRCRVAGNAADLNNVGFLVGFLILGLLATLYQEGKRQPGKKSPEMLVMEQLGSIWAKITGSDMQTQKRVPKINMEGIDNVPFQTRKVDGNTTETQVRFLEADELQAAKRKLEASLQAMKAAVESLERPSGQKQKMLDELEDTGSVLLDLLSENSASLAQVESADLMGISARLACIAKLESATPVDRQRALALRGRLESLLCSSSLDDEDALELLEAGEDDDVKALLVQLDDDRQASTKAKTAKRSGER